MGDENAGAMSVEHFDETDREAVASPKRRKSTRGEAESLPLRQELCLAKTQQVIVRLYMKDITLHNQWVVKASIKDVFRMMTSFEEFPRYFPKVAESIKIKKREGNYLEMDVIVRSFGRKLPVKMKTQILPEKGFISDNDSFVFGTSGHEELFLSVHPEGTMIDYTYRISIHKAWLRVVATPLIRWYSMKYWEKAVINELKRALEK